AGAFWSTRKSERHARLCGSSRLGYGAARFRDDAMGGFIDFLVNQLALEVEEHGAKPNRDRADIDAVLALLQQLRARGAACYARNIVQHRTSLGRRNRN